MWLFIVVFLIYNLLIFYIGWNGLKWLKSIFNGIKRRLKYLYWILLVLFAYSFIISRWAGDHNLINWTGAIWLGLFYIFMILLPLVNLTVYLIKFTNIARDKAIKWAGIITLLIAACLFTVGVFTAYHPVVTSYKISIPKQVEGEKNYKIVMASDLHFSYMVGSGQAEKLVRMINSLHPDLVLLPGDMISDDIDPYLKEGIPDILKKIKAPVYASLGNHDREDPNVDLIKTFNNSGMKLLADEVVELDNGITLVGRKDRGYQDVKRMALSELMVQTNPTKPVILLEHQPYDLDIAKRNGVDLILSGHTHQGQIFPGNLVTNRIYENDWGYLKKGQLQSIVSSGYGFWGTPLRIGTKSEVVQIDISFK
ncbi:metallophosphoesterase [Neobacillus dielmonensis]|uniref:metallophosphoesterase n=1 Tax=Neobacillus dielmonensis TaxID=1347369 RepID=UPI0005A6C279|nr:metallophosphoesterase [Neobacillus dielmonensis]